MPTSDPAESAASRTSRPIQDVKRANEERLLALPGVVLVGVGLSEDGEPAIIVGLDKDRPETRAKVPATMDGYPVIVRVVGTIRSQYR